MRKVLLCTALLGLVACSPAQQDRMAARIEKVEKAAFKAGQLYCAFRAAGGATIIAAAADLSGVPVIVIGMAKQKVDQICARMGGGVAVSPPANASPEVTPVIAVDIPK